MNRRHFLTQSALWGGGMALSINWLPSFHSTASPLSGGHFAQFSSEQQAFLQQFSESLADTMLAENSDAQQYAYLMLYPAVIIRQDVKSGFLSYRNAGGQVVELEKRKGSYTIRFMGEA